MRLALVLGTRPEIIKNAPLIRALPDMRVIHTGQHYSPVMDAIFFEELELRSPDVNLKVSSGAYNERLARMVDGIMKNIDGIDGIIVQGDTNSVLAGALAAIRSGKKLIHHEAGIRCGDTRLLEEVNRVIVDQLAHIRFAPTQRAMENLEKESLTEGSFLVGNTIVDAIHENKERAEHAKIRIPEGTYALLTMHRAENVDDKQTLQGILEGLEHIPYPCICPLHPRTRTKLDEYSLYLPKGIGVIDPLGYLDFLKLMMHASLIITDSGGIQEEAAILGIPCVTVRDSTERPETINAGVNVLAGTKPASIRKAIDDMTNREYVKKDVYGSVGVSRRIVDILAQSL